jgi:hypothetical protein
MVKSVSNNNSISENGPSISQPSARISVTPRQDLPRLLYIGDVPVESALAGSALLYRLLMTWPVGRIRIIEPTMAASSPRHRLPGVDYLPMRFGVARLLKTRFSRWYAGHLFHAAQRKGAHAARLAGAPMHGIDAVLTVAHGYTWATAADVARRLGTPLHLIVHDDAIVSARVSPRVAKEMMKEFAEVYRSAQSRLCVSPYMAEEYERRFGAAGDVLYPSRAAGANGFDAPPPRLIETNHPLTYGYAGSLHTPSYVQSLASLSRIAERRGERLLIFSNLSLESATRAGLGGAHVDVQPIVPFQRLVEILRERVDVLFVPMSFDPAERLNTEIGFPSKLTDYTMAGLPLLIQGPDYCSAVRWARANPGVAAVVEGDSSTALEAAMLGLSDPDRRLELARSAIRVGEEYFSHEAVFGKFVSKVCPNFPSRRAVNHGQ